MWFTNARIFQFVDKVKYDTETIDSALENLVFTPCSKHLPNSMGWEAPLKVAGAPMVHACNGVLLMCLRIEEKIIPANVINEQLNEKIEEITSLENRRVSRKEKTSLKEEIYNQLLPQAFCQSTRLYGYIDTKTGWLIVNTSSAKKAELFTSLLRKSLGQLKLQLPQIHSPTAIISQWLSEHTLPQHFEFNDYCVMQDHDEEPGTIRCHRQDLLSDEIQNCLKEGRFVTELGLTWLEQISFTLDQDFSIRKIKFLDLLKEQAKESYAETYAEQFDANFALMTQTLRQLLGDLMTVFAIDSVRSTASETENA